MGRRTCSSGKKGVTASCPARCCRKPWPSCAGRSLPRREAHRGQDAEAGHDPGRIAEPLALAPRRPCPGLSARFLPKPCLHGVWPPLAAWPPFLSSRAPATSAQERPGKGLRAGGLGRPWRPPDLCLCESQFFHLSGQKEGKALLFNFEFLYNLERLFSI